MYIRFIDVNVITCVCFIMKDYLMSSRAVDGETKLFEVWATRTVKCSYDSTLGHANSTFDYKAFDDVPVLA